MCMNDASERRERKLTEVVRYISDDTDGADRTNRTLCGGDGDEQFARANSSSCYRLLSLHHPLSAASLVPLQC